MMANSVECLLYVNEIVVKVALVLYRCFAIMTMQLKICSTVRRPSRNWQHFAWMTAKAYGPAVLALSEASLLW